MKKTFFIIITILFFIAIYFVGCSREGVNQQALISEYVKNNQTTLLKIIKEINFNEEIKENEIIEKLPKGIKILDVYKTSKNSIEFDVGEGFISSSHYYGFYYTSKDVPLAAGIEDKRLKKGGNGYRIQEEGKEDWYYTEKIVDNFYFYEEHY